MRDNQRGAESTVQLASSTARAVTSYEMIRQRTRSTSSPCWISSLSRTFTSGKAGHTVTGTGRKKVAKNTTLRNQLQKKYKKRRFLSIHDRFIRDTWFRKTMMDKLANEDHTHIATEEEIDVYRGNW